MADPTPTPEIVGNDPKVTPSPTTDAGKIFTQEQLASIVSKERTDGQNTARAALFAKFGVKDETELETKLANLSKLETERLSEESERLQKETADAKAEADKATKREQEKTSRANDRLRLSAIRTAASDKFNPDAYDDMWRYIKDNKSLYEKLKVTDDDEVEGVADVLKELEEKKKLYLKQAAATTTPAPRGTPPSPNNRAPAVPSGDMARDQFARDIKNW